MPVTPTLVAEIQARIAALIDLLPPSGEESNVDHGEHEAVILPFRSVRTRRNYADETT